MRLQRWTQNRERFCAGYCGRYVSMNIDLLNKNISSAFFNIERPVTSLLQFLLTDAKGLSGEISDQEWRYSPIFK